MDNLARSQSVAVEQTVMPNLVPNKSKPSFQKMRNDFIRHPQQFPFEFRRTREWSWTAREQESPQGDLGLSFVSRKYIPTGTKMELSIPLRGIVQKFQGTVVMVRETSQGYDIGLWLASQDDASRARLAEQICHLECSLRGKLTTDPSRPRLEH